MADNLCSPEWVDRIESLVHQAAEIEDAAARALLMELSQAIMQFHSAALSRALDIIGDFPSGGEILSRMAADELTSSLLLVHDLHPEATEVRVERAVIRLDNAFRALGARISLASLSGGVVCVNFESSRLWPGAQTRASIEKFLFQAAPELDLVVIDGMKEEPARDFVPLTGILVGLRP